MTEKNGDGIVREAVETEGGLRMLLRVCLTDVVLRVGEREVDLVLMRVHLDALEQHAAEAGRAKGRRQSAAVAEKQSWQAADV
jgi:hypothetical protein